ncbi:MAG: beta-lactamase family protein, partial [Bryobacterales bacterium]|nr:beta-lactamase family protein [Bryobacterales bacterium]
PLVSYIDDLTDARARKVTIGQVLSHSGGFPNWRFEPGQPLESAFEPGTRWQYSGEGYVYLQRILEKVSGKAFGELIGELVFQPLGMSNTTILPLAANQPRLALPHNRRGEVVSRRNLTSQAFVDFARSRNRRVESLTYEEAMLCVKESGARAIADSVLPNAAASMVTCATDYARFVAAAMRNPALTEQQVRIRQGNDFDLGWGLGWGTERVGTREFLWQWGDNGGYKNIVFAEPVRGEAIFVFTNGDNGARVYERVLSQVAGFDHPALFV